ncbi:MAG TPA: SDR family NAD(P)-dependent oxidoreductase [Sphingomicrobium sp.]
MKTILITGVTSGIGLASARRFAAAGWRVVGTGRRGDRLRSLAEELGATFLPLELDMRDLDAVAELARLSSPWGEVDVLLNNAGFAPPQQSPQDAEWTALESVISTNITGLVALTRTMLPKLIERRGAIVNLSSVAATYPYKGGSVYGGSKAFVRQFSLDLRCDLEGTGVRVTSIEPGMVETEFTVVRTGSQQASDTLYADMDPLTAQDIAEQVWWVVNLPPHVNINTLEIMPVNQSWAGFAVHRNA